MSGSYRIGQLFKGRLDSYTVAKKVRDTIWLAKDQTGSPAVIKFARGNDTVRNERDILKRFQGHSHFIGQLKDEVEVPASSDPAIVLEYLEDDLLSASKKRPLTGKEIKYVSKQVLRALDLLHSAGYVHTDLKLDNVLVNYKNHDHDSGMPKTLSDIHLADFGGTSHVNSQITKAGGNHWGARLANTQLSDGEYELQILIQQSKYFGPFPPKYVDLVRSDEIAMATIAYVLDTVESLTPFNMTTEREVSKADKEFICKIMKIDPRDRPTAKELLLDPWFEPGLELS
ncbi:STE protein kinase [Capronia epimyces CBS 606.96]|uniref:STE protein kinase n=1 Tax=Capronia epimyces CBS 606.96 TaxID=1182542 RepID=W9Y3A7_9EURO|nr:STE protein kinase [Capronia epimyces CBS 606.96]EXJ84125.1 STE protein kinase [Capronia epimyces CBS 606.96]